MKIGSCAWGIPSGADALESTDVSIFSSSLPVLPHEKLKFIDSDHGVQSLDDASSELDKLKDAMDDLDVQEVGILLPDDEEELLAGIMDDFDLRELPSQVEELDDDIFDSGGGMELDSDPIGSLTVSMAMARTTINDGYMGNGIGHCGLTNGVGTVVAGEHPYGEHPSRTLFVRNINSNVDDSELRSLFEQYGDIRALYTVCKHRGFVMISYYDIRDARTAMRALQNKPLRRRKLDIHFSIPKHNPSDKDMNQGTLVVFNLDPSVSNDDLLQIFGAYGEVKEIRETPHKRHHKFIEYYDIRAAEAALRSLNRVDIAGKRIKLEPSRPGGARRNLMQQLTQETEQDEMKSYRYQVGSPLTNSPPGTWAQFGSPSECSPLQAVNRSPSAGANGHLDGNHLPGLASLLPSLIPNSAKIAPIGKDTKRISPTDPVFSSSNLTHAVALQGPFSFPEYNSGMIPNMSSSPRSVPSFGQSTPNTFRVGMLSGPNSAKIAPIGKETKQINPTDPVFSSSNLTHEVALQRPFSFPENNSGMMPNMSSSPRSVSSFGQSTPNTSGVGMLSGPQFLWGTPPYPENSQSSSCQSASMGCSIMSKGHGIGQGNGAIYPSRHSPFFSSLQNHHHHHHHHVGSAPSVIPFERNFAYFHESPDASFVSPVGFRGLSTSRNEGSLMMNYARSTVNHAAALSGNISENRSPNFRMLPSQRISPSFYGNTQYPGIGSIDSEGPVDHNRSRRVDNSVSQLDSKKQYQLDFEKIVSGEDTRTTLMIKNIPNKYTSKMLLAAIDETHKGTYDFLYLPIDFKNKCNVGYAFINMVFSSHIVSFYQVFNGKKWEKFNSEKVASLAYARIQGKAALVTHFQNSSLMNEDKRCRPILFHSQGSEVSDQEPFLTDGIEVRTHDKGFVLGNSPESSSENDQNEKLSAAGSGTIS